MTDEGQNLYFLPRSFGLIVVHPAVLRTWHRPPLSLTIVSGIFLLSRVNR